MDATGTFKLGGEVGPSFLTTFANRDHMLYTIYRVEKERPSVKYSANNRHNWQLDIQKI